MKAIQKRPSLAYANTPSQMGTQVIYSKKQGNQIMKLFVFAQDLRALATVFKKGP